MSPNHVFSLGIFGISHLSIDINLFLDCIVDEFQRLILSDHFRDRNNNFIQDSIIITRPSINIYRDQSIRYSSCPKFCLEFLNSN